MLVIICIVYTCLFTPYRESFFTYKELQDSNAMMYIEITIDVIFFLDIIVNFMSAYENIHGKIIYN